ncbi:MAG: hypothetical protein MI924_16605, partial [Chloroflexales bacterium]|nr:hypothetical protein [Chloroflexales bacterium]
STVLRDSSGKNSLAAFGCPDKMVDNQMNPALITLIVQTYVDRPFYNKLSIPIIAWMFVDNKGESLLRNPPISSR